MFFRDDTKPRCRHLTEAQSFDIGILFPYDTHLAIGGSA